MTFRHIIAVATVGAAALVLAGAGDPGRAPPAPVASDPLSVSDGVMPQCEVAPEVGTVFESAGDLELPPSAPARATAESDSPCPDGMAHVAGEYCTEVKHECLEWLDDKSLPYARCARYSRAAQCVGRRIPMSFCMDRFEYTRPGEELPANHMSFDTGQKLCRSSGKRLCTESEWNFACEGEELRPYPYGWEREAKCNQDRPDLFDRKLVGGQFRQVLRDHREPSRADSECVSPFGIVNMVGNLDEPVLREATRLSPPFRNALKGGWWMAARNRCRPATTAHDDFYEDVQVGVRCCADLAGDTAPTG